MILSILPDNDFTDDDFSKAPSVYGDRYRPYLIGRYPDYELRYTQNKLKGRLRDMSRYVEGAFNEFSYTAKAYSYFKAYFKMRRRASSARKPDQASGDAAIPSRYFDFSGEEFDRMRYAIEQIVALAAPRPVLVISIPRRSDYARAKAVSARAPLSEKLEALSRTAHFTYIDLLERTGRRSDLNDLFHSCDPHWSAAGHAMAAHELGSWTYYAGASASAR